MRQNFTSLMMILIALFMSTGLMATDYVVSGAGTTEANGTYIENGEYDDKPKYEKSGYVLFWDDMCNKWKIATSTYSQSIYNILSSASTPPETGWQVACSGTDPAPTVSEAVPSLSYSSNIFFESINNDGTIATTITIICNNFDGLTFTGSNGDDFVSEGKVMVSNVPVGLTTVITRINSLELAATFTGTASDPDHDSDVSNLTFAFQNSAFSTGDASLVTNATKNDLQVQFRNLINIPADQSTIALGITNASSGDILNVAADTYTEPGLTIDKNLVIKGQDASTTFIQAHANAGSASDNVFDINSGLYVFFKNVTIQHGNTTSLGGGVYSNGSYVEINNCIITNNSISGSQGGGVYCENGTLKINNSSLSNNSSYTSTSYSEGGGIFMRSGNLEINNSTISDNSCRAKSSANGGGLWTSATTIISNSTFSGNTGVNIGSTESFGGGIYCYNNSCEITNSTISGNSITTSSNAHGGGIHVGNKLIITNSTISENTCNGGNEYGDGLCCYNSFSSLTISNTIIANNGTYDYYVVYPTVTITDNGYNIIGNSNVAANNGGFNNATNILYNTKYDEAGTGFSGWTKGGNAVGGTLNLSSTLADNNTINGTQTLALSSGSFAIDAGTGTGLDQRGVPVYNGTKDIGAYEFNSNWVVWNGSSSSDWSSGANWRNGTTPASTADIGIDVPCDHYPSLTSAISCKNLNIPDQAEFTIEDNGSLTTTSDLNNEGTFTIQSNADGTGSLIVEGTATGDITVQRYLTQGKWHYISSPVNDTRTFNTFLGLTGGANNDQFYWWDEDGTVGDDTGIWFDILNSPTGISYTENSFNAAQGYAITYAGSGSETIDFSGVPYTDNKTITITKTDGSTGEGSNLIGNPFSSDIAITETAQATNNFIAQNLSLFPDDAQALYYWDEAIGDYATKNNGSGAIFAEPGQGFMVLAKSNGTITFNENSRKHGTSQFYKNSNESGIKTIDLQVIDAENNRNNTTISFLANMTLGLDPSYDAMKLKGNPNIALYTRLVEDNGTDIAIQALPTNNSADYIIPVGLDIQEETLIEFSINTEAIEETDIIFEDRETGSFTDLKKANYTTTVSESGVGRFFLHVGNVNSIENPTSQLSITGYFAGDNLVIKNPENRKGEYQLFDLQGKTVKVGALNGSNIETENLNIPTGVYILKVKTNVETRNMKVVKM